MPDLVINRVGTVEGDASRGHFMRDRSGSVTACGKRAVSVWGCTKDCGIASVDCPECWAVKRAAA